MPGARRGAAAAALGALGALAALGAGAAGAAAGAAAAPLKVPLRGVGGGALLPPAEGRAAGRALRAGGALQGGLSGGTVGEGYFAARVRLGTPSSEFDLVVDTGSAITYAPCGSCGPRCGAHRGGSRLDPQRSSTSAPVPCLGTTCAELCRGGHGCGCTGLRTSAGQGFGRLAGLWEQSCQFDAKYAEGSGVSGPMVQERLGLGPAASAGSAAELSVAVGCATEESGDLHTQDADGILGLSRSPLSIHSQLVAQGGLEDVFALCLGAGTQEAREGYLVLGGSGLDAAEAEPVWVPLSGSSEDHFYRLPLAEVTVLGPQGSQAQIGVPPSGAILDSGTTYTYLEPALYEAFRDSVLGAAQPELALVTPHNVCWEAPATPAGAGGRPRWEDLADHFPEVVLGFEALKDGAGTAAQVRFRPQNYLFWHPDARSQVCLGVFSAGRVGGDSILGGVMMRDMLVVFDKGGSRVGFAPASCGGGGSPGGGGAL